MLPVAGDEDEWVQQNMDELRGELRMGDESIKVLLNEVKKN